MSSRDVVSGTQITLTVPEKGRFTLPSQPESGFRVEAIADGSRLMFVSGQDQYDVQCAAALIEPDGAWYLWVRHETAPEGRTSLPNIDLTSHVREFDS